MHERPDATGPSSVPREGQAIEASGGPRLTRRAFLGGSVAVGTLLAAGCSTGTPGSSPGATAAGGAATSTPARTAVKTLRVGVPSDLLLPAIQRFNPANQPLRRTVFDTLLDKKPDGTYRPSLASSWEWAAGNKTLVINLRQGVTYHNGRAFGPEDVIANIQGAVATGSGVQVANLLKRASGIKQSGPAQLTVTFAAPFTSYLDALAALPIVDTTTFKTIGEGKQVIGTGPFKWSSYTPLSKYELVRNPSYWDSGTPSFDTVTFSVISDSQAMLAAVRAGDLDLVNRMVARDAASLKQDSRFSVTATEGYDSYVGANTKVKPLDDIRVRQAIAYSLDRPRIAEQVYGGFAEPSASLWSSSTPGVTKAHVERYTYDIAKAKALLQSANAVGAEVALTSNVADPAMGAAQQIVHFGLEQAGFKVKPISYDTTQFPTHIQAGDFPGLWITDVGLTVMGHVTALMTANPLTPAKNTHNFTPPEYQSLVGKVVDAASDSERASATTALTNYMQEQAFHNTFVQARTPIVGVAGLSGVEADTTLALVLTRATLMR